jgi:hypothetical protein
LPSSQSMAAPPPPAACAAMFARLSASRPPSQAIGAFAGGALDTTMLSICREALLPFFTTRTALPLRAACKDTRAAIAQRGWEDVDTAILGSLSAWAACFPAARAGNAAGRVRAGAPPISPEEWASLRALREPSTGAPSLRGLLLLGADSLLLLGAGKSLAEAARDALPGVRVTVSLTEVCVARQSVGEGATGLAVLDSGLLVSCAADSTPLRLWSAATGVSAGSIEGGKGGRIAALPGGRFAIAGWSDASASVWDAASRARVCELTGHSGRVRCVAPLPGGLVATGGSDATVRLWTTAAGAPVATLQHGGDVWALAVLSDGRLVSGGVGGIRLWDLSTRACTAIACDSGDSVWALAALEGGLLASGYFRSGVLRLWKTASGKLEANLYGHKGAVLALVSLPRGLMASGGSDPTVRVWSVAARACVAVVWGHLSCLFGLSAYPGGRLAGGSKDVICVWDLQEA